MPRVGQAPRRRSTHRQDAGPRNQVPLVKYTVADPAEYIEGDLESLPFYAGESVSLVREILPAKEIVTKIADEARGAISDRLTPLTK